jgi:prolyl-tRNA editing enzyme YbaK/EbsC (Cys-tRNA(Pro) deacylase)
MPQPLSKANQRVQEALRDRGVDALIRALPDSTRTAAEAAQAIGCSLGQIAKSLVFRAQNTGRPVLVIASGANRVNEQAVAAILGEPVAKADADYARMHTGFAIGGVPPVGHPTPLLTIIDEDLLQYAEIWAAAGSPHAVFPLAPGDLTRLTGGSLAAVASKS